MPSSYRAAYLPGRALLHPVWIGALFLLIANDHFLKGSGLLHRLVTGKLSDVAGLLVAPMLLATLLRARSRRAILACHAAVGLVFALSEIWPGAADALVGLVGLTGIRWRMWPDLTDLLALPALYLSARLFVPAAAAPLALSARFRSLGQQAAVTVGLLACFGTSRVQEPIPPAPPELEGALFLYNGSGRELDVTVAALHDGDCAILRDNRESIALPSTRTLTLPQRGNVVLLDYPPSSERCAAIRITTDDISQTLVLRGGELSIHRSSPASHTPAGTLYLGAAQLHSSDPVIAAALAPDPDPAPDLGALAGRWRMSDGSANWTLEYDFEPPRYSASGSQGFGETGSLSLLEREDRRFRVRFAERNLDGEHDDDIERWISLAPDGQSLRIGDDVFLRVTADVTVAE